MIPSGVTTTPVPNPIPSLIATTAGLTRSRAASSSSCRCFRSARSPRTSGPSAVNNVVRHRKEHTCRIVCFTMALPRIDSKSLPLCEHNSGPSSHPIQILSCHRPSGGNGDHSGPFRYHTIVGPRACRIEHLDTWCFSHTKRRLAGDLWQAVVNTPLAKGVLPYDCPAKASIIGTSCIPLALWQLYSIVRSRLVACNRTPGEAWLLLSCWIAARKACC